MTRALISILLVLVCCAIPHIAPAQSPATTQAAVGFEVVDLYVDSGNRPLAAWQVELVATSPDVKIVGVEGGEHKDIYHDPPYYDPAALAGRRIIIASYTTDENPPKGRIHVARIHLQSRGAAELNAKLMAAAEPAGGSIQSSASVVPAKRTKEKE